VDSQTMMIVVVVAVAVLVAIGAYAYMTQQRRKLRDRFGPEYERTLEHARSTSEADAILKKRAARVDRFKLHPLTREQADAFAAEWRTIQSRFVDDPDAAVGQADTLIAQVLTARGYPPADFDKRADDVSVDHPHVVSNYRTARTLMERRARGEAGTEELRVAVINYRSLFDDLLEVREPQERRAS
jgi:hypothetical protein